MYIPSSNFCTIEKFEDGALQSIHKIQFFALMVVQSTLLIVAALLGNTPFYCSAENVSPSHARLVHTIQPTVPHSLSMHKKVNSILPPTPL